MRCYSFTVLFVFAAVASLLTACEVDGSSADSTGAVQAVSETEEYYRGQVGSLGKSDSIQGRYSNTTDVHQGMCGSHTDYRKSGIGADLGSTTWGAILGGEEEIFSTTTSIVSKVGTGTKNSGECEDYLQQRAYAFGTQISNRQIAVDGALNSRELLKKTFPLGKKSVPVFSYMGVQVKAFVSLGVTTFVGLRGTMSCGTADLEVAPRAEITVMGGTAANLLGLDNLLNAGIRAKLRLHEVELALGLQSQMSWYDTDSFMYDSCEYEFSNALTFDLIYTPISGALELFAESGSGTGGGTFCSDLLRVFGGFSICDRGIKWKQVLWNQDYSEQALRLSEARWTVPTVVETEFCPFRVAP